MGNLAMSSSMISIRRSSVRFRCRSSGKRFGNAFRSGSCNDFLLSQITTRELEASIQTIIIIRAALKAIHTAIVTATSTWTATSASTWARGDITSPARESSSWNADSRLIPGLSGEGFHAILMANFQLDPFPTWCGTETAWARREDTPTADTLRRRRSTGGSPWRRWARPAREWSSEGTCDTWTPECIGMRMLQMFLSFPLPFFLFRCFASRLRPGYSRTDDLETMFMEVEVDEQRPIYD